MFGKKSIIVTDVNDIPCKAEKVTIEGDLKYDILKGVSDNMVKCYNSYFRGEEEMFSGIVGENVTFCAVCYKMDYENKDIEIDMFELMEFQHLKSTRKETYMEILGSKIFANEFGLKLDELESDDRLKIIALDTSKESIVVFKYIKTEASKLSNIPFGVGAAAGAATGAAMAAVAITAVGAWVVFSGGSALVVLAAASSAFPLATGAGGLIGGYMGYQSAWINVDGDVWFPSIHVVEFNQENLKALGCERIVGVNEPGITTRG